MANMIPIEVKKTCCDMFASGTSLREIYDDYFVEQFDIPQSYKAFTTSIKRWMDKKYPEDLTLEKGTYEGFIAHDATVQVSKDGEIIQAWIKQKASDIDLEEFLTGVREAVEPYEGSPGTYIESDRMLEIPLFDMHWGVAFMDYYKPVLDEILGIIQSKHWDRIVIPFGQDFFHNDSIVNGQTTKGTLIEKVDMVRAVRDSKQFMYAIVDAALSHSNEVSVLYTAGNHDRSISWMFIQVLLERYGLIVDDSITNRKVVAYGKNAIMFTHGDSKQATPKNLAQIFPISFASEFANADVREVHAGHLHREAESDIYGVMVRRLSTGGQSDEWADKEDFIGAHKRFMLFEWDLNKLRSIHYI